MDSAKIKRKILIIDDDIFFCDIVKESFAHDESLEVQVAHSGLEAFPLFSKINFDVILLDNHLPNENGLNFVADILKFNEHTKIILITAHPSLENAIQALQRGIDDYLLKPVELEALHHTIKRCLRISELEKIEQIQYHKNSLESEKTLLQISSLGFDEIKFLVEKAAQTQSNAPVLITGETGTGKSVIAKYLHHFNSNKKQSFISINCATLPENLIEAELFGVEKGAFTGAVSRKGLIALAEGGTLFLDEITEMPLHLQSKLLGVLDNYEVRKLGSETAKSVSVRIIAATNVDIEKSIEQNLFRQDLYYRLNLISLHVQPLRTKRDIIPKLCDFFLKELSPEKPIELSAFEQECLVKYNWPGNIRELKNVLERALILQEPSHFQPSSFLAPALKNNETKTPLSLQKILPLQEVEYSYIKNSLEQMKGNITQTAKALGISISTLKRKLRK